MQEPHFDARPRHGKRSQFDEYIHIALGLTTFPERKSGVFSGRKKRAKVCSYSAHVRARTMRSPVRFFAPTSRICHGLKMCKLHQNHSVNIIMNDGFDFYEPV